MAVNLKGRSFLTLMDFTPEEIRYMLDLAHDLKSKKRAGINNQILKGKNVVLLLKKPPRGQDVPLKLPAWTKAPA